MNDPHPCSCCTIAPAIHKELDRLRAFDWTKRPSRVELSLGPLSCDYDEQLGTSGWVCLDGIVGAPNPTGQVPDGTAPTSHGPRIRIWIPQQR